MASGTVIEQQGAAFRLIAEALDRGHPTVLMLLHDAPGGTRRFVKTLAIRVAGRTNVVFGAGRGARLRLCLDPDRADEGVELSIPQDLSALVEAVGALNVHRVDVHHVRGFDREAEQILQALALPYDLHLLDYHLAAENAHLRNDNSKYVGDDRYITTARSRPAFVQYAQRWIAISRDLATRLRRFWPDLNVIAASTVEDPPPEKIPPSRIGIGPSEPLRVVLSDIGIPHKGRRIVVEAMEIVVDQGLPITFHVGSAPLNIGDVRDLPPSYSSRTRMDRAAVIAAVRPHIAWLPFQVPETYSFALSDMMMAGLPILASSIGAASERLHGRPYSWLLPSTLSAEEWVDMLLRLRSERLETVPMWTSVGHLIPAVPFYPEEYLEPLLRTSP